MVGAGIFSLFGVIAAILIIALLIKCCLDLDKANNPKVTRTRSYIQFHQESPQQTSRVVSATAPPRQIELIPIDSSDIDGITVIPDFDADAASPVVVPPYPVEPRHPTPGAGPPGLGFTTHNPPYPTHNPHPMPGAAPYPPAAGHAPYPPVAGSTPYPPTGSTPYPPTTRSTPYPPAGPPVGTAPYPDYSTQPPSYSEAVSQPPVEPLPSKDGYSKQAPYNPNY